ncbi:MAG: methylated-DNA--[protein]-cysteine S-methyltransferase [Candidatus Sphingomonas colombiensis]|nr:methylated-DNA--[protein]-cysteine S-methyltransferase [Sphingomonas sp.]WEK43914.1 MAG: methylated-DNA--[protein]-cysteine S-methyltransferase [Sphingomonas sp.]
MFSHPTQPVRYGFGTTEIGLVLVAVGSAGVASILIGDDRARLRRDLHSAIPNATLIEDQAAIAGALAQVERLIADPRCHADLRLNIGGSDAERAVWSALRAIPVGETRSYGQIARTLSVPMTAQEVGAACAANVIALAIPCHRVVKADGGISGYRWGVARKRRLLQIEAAA